MKRYVTIELKQARETLKRSIETIKKMQQLGSQLPNMTGSEQYGAQEASSHMYCINDAFMTAMGTAGKKTTSVPWWCLVDKLEGVEVTNTIPIPVSDTNQQFILPPDSKLTISQVWPFGVQITSHDMRIGIVFWSDVRENTIIPA